MVRCRGYHLYASGLACFDYCVMQLFLLPANANLIEYILHYTLKQLKSTMTALCLLIPAFDFIIQY